MVRHPGFSGISAQVGARDMKNEIGINQLKRRDFLKAGLVFGAGAAGIAPRYAAGSDAISRAGYAAQKKGAAHDNVLGMIQLAGGEDRLRAPGSLRGPQPYHLPPTLA